MLTMESLPYTEKSSPVTSAVPSEVRFSIPVRVDGLYSGRNPGDNATLILWPLSRTLPNPFAAALSRFPF